MAINFNKDSFESTVNDGIATISYTDKATFMDDCPVSKQDAVDVFKQSGNYITAATQTSADMATEMFKKDKTLEKVIIDYPYGPTGSGKATVAVDREKTFRVPGADANASVTRPNVAVKVAHTSIKAGKTFIKSLQQDMLEALK